MKKIIVLLLISLGLFSDLAAQNTTMLPVGYREPTYYYWDSNWVDVKGICNIVFWNGNGFKTSQGRYCYIDTTLKVIGIAAAIYLEDVPDKQLQPEYFQLYEIGDSCDLDLRLLAEARWDTMTPRYSMQFPCFYNIVPGYPVYEAYFDKPYLVSDSFFVVTTANSCYRGPNENGRVTQPYRTFTIANAADPYENWRQEPPYILCRTYVNMTYNPDASWNMKWGRNELPGTGFQAIFPIFDTAGMSGGGNIVRDTACQQEVRGLSVLDVNAESATLMWDSEGQTVWEVSYGHSGTPAEDGTILSTTSSITTLEGLDTATWYVAYVRSICPNSAPGVWSDSVRFYVPADSTHRIEPTGTPSLISLYTQIMPNPAKDEVMVISSFSISQIEVFSLAGKLLDSFDYGNVLQARLRVDSYPSGAYFIRVHTPSGTTTKKLIIR